MGYFPFFTDIKNKKIAVIGGGRVAYRKVRILADYEPLITVTAPDVCDEIYSLSERYANIEISEELFSEELLRDAYAVISATSDSELNLHIYSICKEKGIPVNTVDDPEKCTFIFPALVHKGSISAGVSSSGTAPAFSAYLRRKIEELLDDRMMLCAELTAEIRPFVREKLHTEELRKKAMYEVIDYIMQSEEMPDSSVIYKLIEDMVK